MKYVYKDNNYRYEDCKWNGNKLLCYGQETGVKLEPHETHDRMFWVVFPEETRYAGKYDFYNLTRAKDNAVKLYIEDMNSELAVEPAEGRGEV